MVLWTSTHKLTYVMKGLRREHGKKLYPVDTAISDFCDLSATTTHAASSWPLNDRVGPRKGRTGSGELPNTSADSELTRWRKGGAGNTPPARSRPNPRFLDFDHQPATTLNAASCRALDERDRVELG